MSSILVVGPEHRSMERISEVLSGEGWRVRVVAGRDQAIQAAASEAPDLVVVSSAVPGVESLASSFSRTTGGPGVLAILSDGPAEPGARLLPADDLLAKPFTDHDLRSTVRRALAVRRPAAPAPNPAGEHKLTSQEIFADVLAEVEKGDDGPGLVAPAPALEGAPPALEVRAPAAFAPQPAASPSARDDVERRLEKTLSGVLGVEPKSRPAPSPAAPPARKAQEAPASDVDALLSKTLSQLDLGARPLPRQPPSAPRPAAPAPAPPAAAAPPPVPAAPTPAAGKPPAPPPQAAATPAAAPPREGAAARKAPKVVGDFDFSELEELARTSSRKSAPARPTAGTAAPAAVTASQAPRPPEPARSAPPPVPAAAAVPVFELEPVPDLPLPPPLGAVDLRDDPSATQRIPVFAREEAGGSDGERFGQYQLLERIAVGGMAEVWKARMRGVEGFQKTVAIKRILPHMTNNSEFVGMFIDEAKLAAQLNHPNIVHIYDLGKIGRDYYIAMEYVEGKDLRSLLNAAQRKGLPLPMGLALLIAARLASALDYAHRKRDFEGKELGLVHRDVSPQNVLITAEGDVKLCDFGIAKAVSKAGQTQMGALKGKLQYMSPEQAWGRQVDPRSDLFSLGAVLFEMLTGERLFPGESEMSVLEAVRQVRTRSPRQLAPFIPPEVDEIVARALAKEPEDRFQTAGEMEQRLEAALYALNPSPNHTDLASYVQRVLAAPDLGELAQPAPMPSLPPLPPRSAMPQIPPPDAGLAGAAPVALPEVVAVEEEAPAVAALAPVGDVLLEEAPRKTRTLLYAVIAAVLLLGVLSYLLFSRRSPEEAPEGDIAAEASAPAALPAPAPAGPAPATTEAAPPAAVPQADIAGLVDEQLAKRKEELQRQFEETQKRLEEELARAHANRQPAAPTPAPVTLQTTMPAEPAPAASQQPEPSPAVSAPAPEPSPTPQQASAPPVEPPARSPEPSPSPEAATPVQAGGEVVAPQLVSFPKPQYPPVARRLRVDGTVVVSVLVDEEGRVQEARVAEGIKQNVGLNEAALQAARAARFRPATKNGVRIKMWTRLKIPFKL